MKDQWDRSEGFECWGFLDKRRFAGGGDVDLDISRGGVIECSPDSEAKFDGELREEGKGGCE